MSEMAIGFWVPERLDIAGWDSLLRKEARYLMETERVMAQEVGFIIARGITRDNKTFVGDLQRLLCSQLLLDEVGDARTAITACVYEQDAENIAKPLLRESFVFRNDDIYPERLNVPALAEKRIGEIFLSAEHAARLGDPGTYPSPSLLNEYLQKTKRERFAFALKGRGHRAGTLQALRNAFLVIGREDVKVVEEPTGRVFILTPFPENDECNFLDILRDYLPAFVYAKFMTEAEKAEADREPTPPECERRERTTKVTAVGSVADIRMLFGSHDDIKQIP